MSKTKLEWRKVQHLYKNYQRPDTLLVSTVNPETNEKKIEVIENYQRPFWVTKPPYQNHKHKKSLEKLSKLSLKTCSQSDLSNRAVKALPFPYNTQDFYRAKDCPYLYGTDQHVEFIAKYNHMGRVCKPGRYDYAALDIETDVLKIYGGAPIIMSVATDGKIHQSVLKDFVKDIPDAVEKIKAGFFEKYPDLKDVELVIELVDGPGVLTNPIKALHQWKPDIVGIWNINYDMPKILDFMERYGINPADVFSDPALPKELRHFEYVEGPKEFVMRGDGYSKPKVKNLGPHERWHKCVTTAFFDFMDAMAVFSEVRSQDAKRQSFRLDAILLEFLKEGKAEFEHVTKYLKLGSAKFNKAYEDAVKKLNEWHSKLHERSKLNYTAEMRVSGLEEHKIMQRKFRIEYCVYNLRDTYSMIELENVIKDFKLKLPVFMGNTPFKYLPKRVKRLNDMTYDYALGKDSAIGTAYSNYPRWEILPLSDWIVTAEAYRRENHGTRCLAKYTTIEGKQREHITGIYCNLLEVDLTSSYPRCFEATRASRGTTVTSVANVGGTLLTTKRRHAMINTLHGSVNAMDIAVNLMNKPKALDVLNKVEELLA